MNKVNGILTDMRRRHLSPERIAAAIFSAFMMSYLFQLMRCGSFGSLSDYYNSIHFAGFFIVAVVVLASLIALTLLMQSARLIPWALMTSAAAVSLLFAANYTGENTVYFTAGVGLIDLIAVLWVVRDDKLGISHIRISRRAALITACILFFLATVIFGFLTSLKYRAYANFTFDFGIFSQMYERMAVTGVPSTTVERSHMMSHFGVHFSPIFYLFLPGYYIFRSPIYLFYIQAAAVASGVFAVWLISGRLGLSGKLTLALELIYAFYPCLMNGTFYDFHENKFLTSIILFLFYFILSRKMVGTGVFSLLLLSVKEDAAIYLIVIALYVMISRREYLRGGIMLAIAVIYFIMAQQIVAAVGTEGVMMDRLSDYFINDEHSFFSVFKALFFDVGYMLQQVFSAEKIPFILWMLLPVLFTPFFTEKISSLILLLPILPINLMQSWQYQYDVDFQYTYGIAALILISAIFVIVGLKGNTRRAVVLTSLCLCLVMSVSLIVPKINSCFTYTEYVASTRDQMDALLEEVPTDATVTAADSLVPHLYKVEWLYTMPDYYTANRDKPIDTDYFVIDTRYSNLEQEMHSVMGDQYTLIRSAGFVELYQHR